MLLVILQIASLRAWTLGFHPIMRSAIYATAQDFLAAMNGRLLTCPPVQAFGTVDPQILSEQIAYLLERDTHYWNPHPKHIVWHIAFAPVFPPFDRPRSGGFSYSSSSFSTIAGGLAVAITLASIAAWHRSIRGTRHRIHDAVVAFALLLWLPLVVAIYFSWYTALCRTWPGLMHLSAFAVLDSALFTLAALLFGLYPLVFLHLRWRRALRRDRTSGSSPTCPRCGYERGELATCPECGAPRTAPAVRLSRAKRRILIAGYAAFPLLLIAPFWLSWIDIAIYHMTH
jgi:hypothetical protein